MICSSLGPIFDGTKASVLDVIMTSPKVESSEIIVR
jgi:hypothetical protein